MQRVWSTLSSWFGFGNNGNGNGSDASNRRPSRYPPQTRLAVLAGIGLTLGLGARLYELSSGYAHRHPSLTQIPTTPVSGSVLRCIPLHQLHLPQYSVYAWNVVVRSMFEKFATVQVTVLMGVVATAVSGAVLSILSHHRGGDSAAVVVGAGDAAAGSGSASDSGSSTDDAAFTELFYEEYDTMMAMAAAAAAAVSEGGSGATANADAALSAVPVTTPRGELVIAYVPARSAFGYYTDRKSSIPYTHLETAARMFLVKNARPDLARLAYVDRRKALAKAADKKADNAADKKADKAVDKDMKAEKAELVTDKDKKAENVADTTSANNSNGGGGGLFAMFKSYNRKSDASKSSSSSSSSSSSEPTPVVDTHFVYLGTMHDYKTSRVRDLGRETHLAAGLATGLAAGLATGLATGLTAGLSGEEAGAGDAAYINIKYSDFKKGRTATPLSSPSSASSSSGGSVSPPPSQRSRL
jgi:hypothetical protein